MSNNNNQEAATTINPAEIQNFTKHSSQWWDLDGPYAAIHKILPHRISYITNIIKPLSNGQSITQPPSLQGLRILDIGCGGGLTSECLARLGADVTGIDADPRAIEIAQNHAENNDFVGSLSYYNNSTDSFLTTAESTPFDVVMAFEILEHVNDVDTFVGHCFSLCKNNGIVIFSTLNKTTRSYLFGILAAEYLLRWVPVGTHNWKNFIKPSTLAGQIRANGGRVLDICGLVYRPQDDDFSLSQRQTDINYFMSAQKTHA